jgi:small subunit ribosomal protein S5
MSKDEESEGKHAAGKAAPEAKKQPAKEHKDKVQQKPLKKAAPKAKAGENDEIVKVIEEVEKKIPPAIARAIAPEAPGRYQRRRRGRYEEQKKDISSWIPKTRLGQEVVKGKFKDINNLLESKEIILEPEIVDYLVPDLKKELVFIGGTPGKGGGARRTPTRMTARMHKSGRRFKLSALMLVGNENGIIGMGKAVSKEHILAIDKATQQAKLNIIKVRRGCGSWECNCGGDHSIPFRTEARIGSVRVVFYPTPTGVGVVAGSEIKKILKLAGIKDVWVKTHGQTSTRMNLASAVFLALKKLGTTKGDF